MDLEENAQVIARAIAGDRPPLDECDRALFLKYAPTVFAECKIIRAIAAPVMAIHTHDLRLIRFIELPIERVYDLEAMERYYIAQYHNAELPPASEFLAQPDADFLRGCEVFASAYEVYAASGWFLLNIQRQLLDRARDNICALPRDWYYSTCDKIDGLFKWLSGYTLIFWPVPVIIMHTNPIRVKLARDGLHLYIKKSAAVRSLLHLPIAEEIIYNITL